MYVHLNGTLGNHDYILDTYSLCYSAACRIFLQNCERTQTQEHIQLSFFVQVIENYVYTTLNWLSIKDATVYESPMAGSFHKI